MAVSSSWKDTVFVSYRRARWQSAELVVGELRRRGYTVFSDRDSLGAGPYPEALRHAFEESRHFVVILQPGALVGFENEDDWLRIELELAIESRSRMVPLLFDGFGWGDAEFRSRAHVGPLRKLSEQQAIEVPPTYVKPAMNRLDAFLGKATRASARPKVARDR